MAIPLRSIATGEGHVRPHVNNMKSIQKYSAVFGRPPAMVRDPNPNSTVSAYMFPPLKRSFWKSLISEAHDQTIYITSGMSSHKLPGCDDREGCADRIELIAFSKMPINGGPDGTEDIPTVILQMIADYILNEQIPIGIGHTLDFQEPLATNIQMSAILFAIPEGIDAKRVRKCTKAQNILNVVPITADELELAKNDFLKLIDKFEAAGVQPVFDCFRSSVV